MQVEAYMARFFASSTRLRFVFTIFPTSYLLLAVMVLEKPRLIGDAKCLDLY
jgi:hypothetical protein